MKIGVCSDHAGFDYKEGIIRYLRRNGYEIIDFGTHSTESMDYPDVGHPLARAVESHEVDLGVALCGTGNGMCMTLNHHIGIRAGLAWNTDIAKLVKEHNNANILVLPARFISYRMTIACIRTWIASEFKGDRHQRRIDKITSGL